MLYVWGLGASGWANQFYAAAVQAGAQDWKAALFGASDAGNAITVDKTPAALWVMDVSARVFGFNSWSMLVPQAVEGVGAVAVLYATVRRVSGHGAGLLAGVVLAVTPVAALMFRFNNPDALLVLLLTVAAYCVLRAIEKDAGAWWLPAAGVAIGFGFLAKMMQAFLVLPVFGVVYLLAAHEGWRTRIRRSIAAVVAVVISAGWYLVLVSVWPADSRPYIGGSQGNSIVELTLGYNGFGRITGKETGGLGNMNFDAGWDRLFAAQMGGQIAWLLPAALMLCAAGLWWTRHAPRTDATRAALLLWSGWLVVTGVVFSFSAGILHPYYTIALAPAIGGAVGVGASLLWRRRNDIRAAGVLAVTVAATAALAWVLLRRTPDWQPWLAPAIVAAGAVAGVLLLLVARLPRRAATAAAALAVVAALTAPTAYSVVTAATEHRGFLPSAGPSSRLPFAAFAGARPDTGAGSTAAPGDGSSPGAPAFPRTGGAFGSTAPGPDLVAALEEGAAGYIWVAATIGSDNAAGYQLACGSPVMALGGYNGTDPAPTVEQFETYVADGKIHYYIDSGTKGGWGGQAPSGSRAAADIATWVKATFTSRTIDGVTIYDLSQPQHAG